VNGCCWQRSLRDLLKLHLRSDGGTKTHRCRLATARMVRLRCVAAIKRALSIITQVRPWLWSCGRCCFACRTAMQFARFSESLDPD
jgi:hypothetical protein